MSEGGPSRDLYRNPYRSGSLDLDQLIANSRMLLRQREEREAMEVLYLMSGSETSMPPSAIWLATQIEAKSAAKRRAMLDPKGKIRKKKLRLMR
jgi:hypothetical protein